MRQIQTILILLLCVLVSCAPQEKESEQDDMTTLTVSAAVSLSDALHDIKQLFTETYHIELQFNFGGSGALAQQIQQGAPVDIFISANQSWMDELEAQQLIMIDSLNHVTGNQLALIAEKGTNWSYQSFAEINPDEAIQIAIGHPDSVPAGQYAKEAFEHLGLWEPLEDRFIFAKDVRQVLTYIETGNADLGIVYESDTYTSEQIDILAVADHSLHEPILYPMAIIKETPHIEEATQFIQFMQSEMAQSILESYGFKR